MLSKKMMIALITVLAFTCLNSSEAKNFLLSEISDLNTTSSDTSNVVDETTTSNEDDSEVKLVALLIELLKNSEETAITSSESNSENTADSSTIPSYISSGTTTGTTVCDKYEDIETTIVTVTTSTDSTTSKYESTEVNTKGTEIETSTTVVDETEAEVSETETKLKVTSPFGFAGASSYRITLLPNGMLKINDVWYAEDVIDIGLDEEGAVVVQGGTIIEDIPYDWVIFSSEPPPVLIDGIGAITLSPTGFAGSSMHYVTLFDTGHLYIDGNLYAFNVDKITLNGDESDSNYGSITCEGDGICLIDSLPNWVVLS